MIIAIALSGGVDSSVAAWLLKQEGHDVRGLFMRGPTDATSGPDDGCAGAAAEERAQQAARALDVPLSMVDVRTGFEALADDFAAAYVRGHTPNPCVLCNRRIKFGALRQAGEGQGAQAFATGHYARLERRDGRVALLRGSDPAKDQSYFLFDVPLTVLARTRFPLGDRRKADVRDLAEKAGLPMSRAPESQDICFIGESGYTSFIEARFPNIARPGDIVDRAGRVLGSHGGVHRYTIGQRKGLGLHGGPWFVLAIHPERNEVVIGKREELKTTRFDVARMVWHLAEPREERLAVQTRYRQRPLPASLHPLGEDRARVVLHTPLYGVTPGQAAVFYDGDRVVAGGWIDLAQEAIET